MCSAQCSLMTCKLHSAVHSSSSSVVIQRNLTFFEQYQIIRLQNHFLLLTRLNNTKFNLICRKNNDFVDAQLCRSLPKFSYLVIKNSLCMTLVVSKMTKKNGRSELQGKCYRHIHLNGILKRQTVVHSMTQNVISLTIYKQNEREAINHWFSHIRY